MERVKDVFSKILMVLCLVFVSVIGLTTLYYMSEYDMSTREYVEYH